MTSLSEKKGGLAVVIGAAGLALTCCVLAVAVALAILTAPKPPAPPPEPDDRLDRITAPVGYHCTAEFKERVE